MARNRTAEHPPPAAASRAAAGDGDTVPPGARAPCRCPARAEPVRPSLRTGSSPTPLGQGSRRASYGRPPHEALTTHSVITLGRSAATPPCRAAIRSHSTGPPVIGAPGARAGPPGPRPGRRHGPRRRRTGCRGRTAPGRSHAGPVRWPHPRPGRGEGGITESGRHGPTRRSRSPPSRARTPAPEDIRGDSACTRNTPSPPTPAGARRRRNHGVRAARAHPPIAFTPQPGKNARARGHQERLRMHQKHTEPTDPGRGAEKAESRSPGGTGPPADRVHPPAGQERPRPRTSGATPHAPETHRAHRPRSFPRVDVSCSGPRHGTRAACIRSRKPSSARGGRRREEGVSRCGAPCAAGPVRPPGPRAGPGAGRRAPRPGRRPGPPPVPARRWPAPARTCPGRAA